MNKKTKEMTISEFSSKGGKASASKLTKEERVERGRKAVSARWEKERALKEPKK